MSFFKTKDGRVCAKMVLIAALALLLGIVGNQLLGWIPYNTAHPDLTDRTTFTLSETSLSYLETLDEAVTITFLCEGGKANADPDLYAFLSRYADANPNVRIRVLDPERTPDILSDHGVDDVSDMSLIVESEKRYRVIDNTQLYYYLNSSYGLIMSPAEYETYLKECNKIDSTGAFAAEFASLTVPYFDGEFCVTNAINFVTCDDVTVAYTLLGNGASELDSSIMENMTVNCYDHRALDSLAAIPLDCELLIIYAPAKDLTDAEAASLSAYLASGGKLFLATHYEVGVLPKLESVLAAYGLGFGDTDAIVCDDENTPYPDFFATLVGVSLPDPFFAYLTGPSLFGPLNCTFLGALAHEIEITPTDGVSVSPLIQTGEQGYLARYNEETEAWGKLRYDEASEKWVEDADGIVHASYCIGVTAQKGETEIFWVSSATALTTLCNAYTEDSGNFVLLTAALHSMGNATNTGVMLSAKPFDVTAFTPTDAQTSLWRVLLIFVIPLVPVVIGVLGILSKRRR